MIILRTVEGSNVAKTSSGVPLNEGSSKVGGELVFARLATARFKLSSGMARFQVSIPVGDA